MSRKSGLSRRLLLVVLGAVTTVLLCEKTAYAYADPSGGFFYYFIIAAFATVTMYVTFFSNWIKKKFGRGSKKDIDDQE